MKRKISFIFSDKLYFMPAPALIKLYTGAPYSHVAMGYFDSVTSQEMLAESSNGEFHKITRQNWLAKNRVIHEVEYWLSEDQYYVIMRHVNNHLQLDYSFKNIVGIPLYDLYEKTGVKLFKRLACLFHDKAAAVICSESVGFILAILGVQFTRPLDFLRPTDIYRAVEKLEVTHGKVFHDL
jgi:hypothetical protein